MSSPLRNRLAGSAGSPLRSRSTALASQVRSFSSTKLLLAPDVAEKIPDHLVQQWDIVKNKLRSPETINAQSTRLIHWQCRSCNAEFKRRVRDHCSSQGQCPLCKAKPGALRSSIPSRPQAVDPQTASDVMPLVVDSPYSKMNRVLDPMLAQRWDQHLDRVSSKEDLFISPKLDGVRCIVAFDPATKRPYFLSRLGNTFQSCDHIAPELMMAFAKDPTLVFDGEIYHHDFARNFSGLIGAIKVQRENRDADHTNIQKQLQLHCFDLLYGNSITGDTPYALRYNYLERVLARLPNKKTQLVEQTVARKAQVNRHHDDHVAEGYEGVMVRTGSGKYEYGKRSYSILKMKKMQDAEFLVTRIIEGKGKLEGTVGAIECVTENKDRFKANFGVSDDERHYYWRRQHQLLGKMATIQFQEVSPNGIPRFGVFKAIRSSRHGTDFV